MILSTAIHYRHTKCTKYLCPNLQGPAPNLDIPPILKTCTGTKGDARDQSKNLYGLKVKLGFLYLMTDCSYCAPGIG